MHYDMRYDMKDGMIDPYNAGKMLAKLGRLTLIADQLDEPDIRDILLNRSTPPPPPRCAPCPMCPSPACPRYTPAAPVPARVPSQYPCCLLLRVIIPPPAAPLWGLLSVVATAFTPGRQLSSCNQQSLLLKLSTISRSNAFQPLPQSLPFSLPPFVGLSVSVHPNFCFMHILCVPKLFPMYPRAPPLPVYPNAPPIFRTAVAILFDFAAIQECRVCFF